MFDYFRNYSSNLIKFSVKIVWLKIKMIIASPMTFTFIEGHKCVKFDKGKKSALHALGN